MKNMKLLRQFALIALLTSASSCAYIFNDKEVDVSINSNPPGADVYIEGRNYGKTPVTIHIEPKSYVATVTKEGYGSAQIQLEWWQAIRDKKGEGGRCLADALGTMLVLPGFSFASVYCREFKQKEYFVNIPRTAQTAGSSTSMIGLGNAPANMIDYYYNQDSMSNPYAKKKSK